MTDSEGRGSAGEWSSTAERLALGDSDDAYGPVPRPTRSPRWLTLAGVPAGGMPTVRAEARRARSAIEIDGRLTEPAWSAADWSTPFVAIESGDAAPLESRVALLWDEDCLYAGFRFEDPDPKAVATEHHSLVFMTDPDAELFVAGSGDYVEVGINPLGTVYEALWTWLEPLIERRDHVAIERLFKVANGNYFTARSGERSGRMGDHDWELPGARYAASVGPIHLSGRDPVHGWSVEFALPWAGLAGILGQDRAPALGSHLRVQGYRAHHPASDPDRIAAMEALYGPGATPFVGWTWAPQGSTNVHNPECWVDVTLAE